MSILHLQNSSIIAVDSPMVFWVVLSFYFIVKIGEGDTRISNYILAGIFTGISVSTKYNSFLMFFPLLMAHISNHTSIINVLKDKKIWLYSLFVVISFIIITPYSILDFKWFLFGLQFESIHYKVGHLGAESADVSYLYYAGILMRENSVIIFILVAYGIYNLIKQNVSKTIVFITFPLIYFLFIGAFRVHFSRNILVLIPFAALLSGYAINELYKKIQIIPGINRLIKLSIYIVIILLVFFIPAQNTFSYWHKINLIDTRIEAKKWIENNIPEKSIILLEAYTPALSKRYSNIKYEGIIGKYQKNLDSIEYVVVSSKNYDRILRSSSRNSLKENYIKIFNEFDLIKDFSADHKKTIGPTIKIFQNKDNPDFRK